MKYGLIGSTDDVTTCDCCGKQNLKKTVILSILDDDNNDNGDYAFFGSTCAENALYNNKQSKTASKVKGIKNKVTIFKTLVSTPTGSQFNIQIKYHSASGTLEIRNLDSNTEFCARAYPRILESCPQIPSKLRSIIMTLC